MSVPTNNEENNFNSRKNIIDNDNRSNSELSKVKTAYDSKQTTNTDKKKVIYDREDSLSFDVDWDTIEENYRNRHHRRHHSRHSGKKDSSSVQTNASGKAKGFSSKSPKGSSRKKAKQNDSYGSVPKKSVRKKIFLGIFLFFLCLIIGTAAAFFILYQRGKSALLNYDNLNVSVPADTDYKDGGNIVYYNGHTYEFNQNITSVLFMGIDNRELVENAIAGKAGQADALYLFTYDTKNGRMRILSLNRDTITDISRYNESGNYYDTAKGQLCLAYAYGDGKTLSAENQVTAVERLLYNVPIHSYFAIDLSAIKILNDDIGGVTLTPEYTFGSFTKGQTITIKGDLAEEFVRRRDISLLDDNLRRMACQKLYINAFANQIFAATRKNVNTPIKLYKDALAYTVTNIDVSTVSYLAPTLALSHSGLEFLSVKGQYKDVAGENYARFEADKTALFETVLELFYTQIK